MKKILLVVMVLLSACSKKVEVSYSNPGPGAPAAPTGPMQLNKNLPVNGNVSDMYQATSDGLKVVYIADEDVDGINELYITDLISGAKKKLNPTLTSGRNVIAFKISPNSTKVAYTAAQNTIGRNDLFTVNLDGTQFNQVNLSLPSPAHSIGNFDWMPNSSKLVYTSDEESVAGSFGLFIANANGSARVTLSAGPVGVVFGIAPNNSRIVYRLGMSNPTLHSIVPDATGDVQLNTPFDLGLQPASGVSGFVISPNSTKVAYRSNQDDDAQYELFAVNIDGSGLREQLNDPMVVGANVAVSPGNDFLFSPDSSRVAYIADEQTNGINELFVKILGGVHSKLNPALIAGGNVSEVQFITNTKVAYLADQTLNNVNELFSVNTDGSNNTKVNSTLSTGENVAQFKVGPGGALLAYAMDVGNAGIFQLYTNTPDGINQLAVSGSLSLFASGAFDNAAPSSPQFKFTNNNRLVFRASLTTTDYQMHSVMVNGSGLTQVSTNSGNVELNTASLGTSFLVLDSGKVVYRQNNGANTNLLGTNY